MTKHFKTLINSPVEKVFSCFEDENKIQNWMHGSLVTEFKTARDPKNPVGSKFRQKAGSLLEWDGEVIAYTWPVSLGIGWKSRGLTGTINYSFRELAPDKTEINTDLEIFDGSSKNKLRSAVLTPLFYFLMEKHLSGIKHLAEKL